MSTEGVGWLVGMTELTFLAGRFGGGGWLTLEQGWKGEGEFLEQWRGRRRGCRCVYDRTTRVTIGVSPVGLGC